MRHPSDPAIPTIAASIPSLEDLERIYRNAASRGADLTGMRADEERLSGPLGLLATTTIHVPLLALLLAELEGHHEPAVTALLAREARRYNTGVLRLTHRALEVHARDVGYDARLWHAKAITNASAALASTVEPSDGPDELGLAVLELSHGSAAVAAAIVAVPSDRIAVPDHLADALGAWLACYVRAQRPCAAQ